MFFVHLYRIIKFALQNFWRNLWLSIVTITIIVLSLFSVTIVVAINGISQASVEAVKDQIDVSVFFGQDVPEERALLFRQSVATLPEVEEAEFVPAAQALARFSAAHSDDALIQETLRELDKNPLGPVLVVKAHDTQDYPALLAQIDSMDTEGLIDEIDFQDREALIEKINEVNSKVTLVAIVVSGAFLFIAILVVFNTIRLGVYAHREEVGIMKLVGASNLYTRAPFVVVSFVYALFSVAIFWIILLLVLSWISPGLNTLLSGIDFNLQQYFTSNFGQLFFWELVGLTVINVVSSTIAIRQYLKV